MICRERILICLSLPVNFRLSRSEDLKRLATAHREKTHPEMVVRASALPPSFLPALAQIVPAERCFSCGNRVPENRLLVC